MGEEEGEGGVRAVGFLGEARAAWFLAERGGRGDLMGKRVWGRVFWSGWGRGGEW